MCSAKTPKAPASTPVSAPMRDVQVQMDNSQTLAARQQALRRGLASVWTRYGEGVAGTTATKDSTLGAGSGAAEPKRPPTMRMG